MVQKSGERPVEVGSLSHDLQGFTLPKANIAPENRPSQKETIVFQPSIFRGYVLVFRGVIIYFFNKKWLDAINWRLFQLIFQYN